MIRRRPGRRLAPLLLALLAVGCARTPPIPPDQDTPQHRACREEARRAPSVRALDRQVNPQVPLLEPRLERERFLAENQAYRDCLRRAGLALPGGVEAIVPRDMPLGGAR